MPADVADLPKSPPPQKARIGERGTGILFVSASDPWSAWSWSGVNLGICRELRARGLLNGAISPSEWTARHLRRPAWLYGLEHRLLGRLGVSKKPWRSEREGLIGRILRRLAPGSVVIYQCLTPEADPSLPLRRFRFMDISVCDAVRTGSYGHEGFSQAQLQEKIEEEKRSLRWCDGVLALSTCAADAISRDLQYPRELITPIGAGPALEMQQDAKTDLQRYAARRILFVGRQWERKGGPLLLEAFKRVRGVFPDVTLTIVGTPQSPGGGGVKWVPALNKGNPLERRQLQELFLSASLFCMPSLCECWGLVYVEAAQAGLPIVGFDDWAMPDIVEDGVIGSLTANRTSEGLAQAMIELLKDPAKMRRFGQAAQQRVRDVLGWDHVVDRLLLRVLPEALEGRGLVPLRSKSQAAAVDCTCPSAGR
jgi:starch synthase